jgi:hypothetical protein
MKVLTVVVVACALLISCISTDYRMLVAQTFPPQATDAPIDIYEFVDQIKRPYIRIARISVVGAAAASFERRRESAIRQAREVGAHAILVEEEREGGGFMIAEHSHSYLALRYIGAGTGK